MHAAPGPQPPLHALGAILAGGASRRFGSTKALAEVGGTRLLDRVRRVLEGAVAHPVLISDRPDVRAAIDLPARGDLRPGHGPLGGVETALRWAEELGMPGALCVACDLPFLSVRVLRRVASSGVESGAHAVVPASRGPGGLEPLCAWYSLRALAKVEAALSRGERSLGSLLAALGAERIPLGELAEYGDPEVIFLNVNTPATQREAERLARQEVLDLGQ